MFVSKLAVLHVCHECPEMQAVTKMADLTKFCQTEWMFLVLKILPLSILSNESGCWWCIGQVVVFWWGFVLTLKSYSEEKE